jgi:VWFA-related protein
MRFGFEAAQRCLVCLLCALPSGVAAPQQPARVPATKDDKPAVKVTARLVEVNVMALDKKGQPVRGLSRDDFQVFDEGQPQAIQVFSVEEKTAPGPGPAAALPPGTFSNDLRQTAPQGTLSVILFDELNTRIQDKLFARSRILGFLAQLRPEDRIAIYLLSDRLRVLHDFSSDTASLLRAIEKQTGTAARRLDSAELETNTIGDEPIDAFLESAARRIHNDALRDRVRRTLNAVEWIARHLGSVPGRKNLVWVSGGFPLTLGFEVRRPGDTSFRDQEVFTADVARATRAVNEANIAIYPIDARGLFTDPMDDGEFRAEQSFFLSRRGQAEGYDRNSEANSNNQARESGGNSQNQQSGRQGARPRPAVLPPPPRSPALQRLDATIDSMVLLAERTGGRAFYNSNDIEGALRQTLDASQVTYRLAFAPTHNRWDGRFRRLRVKVHREGVRLHHRLGYLAQPDAAAPPGQEWPALRETAASPIAIGQIALRAQVLPAAASQELRLRVFVSPAHLLLASGDGRWAGTLDVYLETTDQAGAPLWSDGRRVSFALSEQQHQAALRDGLPLNKTLPHAPEARQLRVALRDVRTGAIGSLRIPLERVP